MSDNYLICDVETYGTDPKNGKLLGVSLCSLRDMKPFYISLQSYDYHTSTWTKDGLHDPNMDCLLEWVSSGQLIGHNYAYDKNWIDSVLGIESRWHACTRLMWHMASAPTGPRPYGLKDAQVEVLGWDKRGDVELEEQVRARGGRLKNGDHYLADVDLLAKYACKDAQATAELYNHLKPFFDKHDYWWMLEKMVQYSWLLQKNTTAGILVDVPALETQIETLRNTKEAYCSTFMELASPHIARMERMLLEDRLAKYQMPAARERMLSTWEKQPKFKLSSDKDKRELFYDSIGLPIVVETAGGKGSTGVDAIIASVLNSKREDLIPLVEAYEQYEKAETLLNSFALPWRGSILNERLHPRFNPCGTVSYRLSGFKPYLLNAPFDEKELMSCLRCDEGWEGVHADFASVEPCVTAHYSQDPNLLKVFRDNRGDIYLDLALSLFPGDRALHEGYKPTESVSKEVKEKFNKQRKIAKVIQLAVQYTGTKYTISKNLSQAGHPTSLAEADLLVKAYWKHFYKVAVMNEALFRKYEATGILRNVVGRIIRVPSTISIRRKDGSIWEKPQRYKDLPNRFIQSSAHDLLSMWVLKIAQSVRLKGLHAKAVILDCHDSTSWQAPKEEVKALEEIFKETLTELNSEVKMTVPVKMEMKRFTTLAGLKGSE